MDLFHWERFEPQLGDNHRLPPAQRLYLEVACGLTKQQLKACLRALDFTSLQPDVVAATKEAATPEPGEKPNEALERVVERMMEGLCVEQLAAAWGPYVRMGAVHTTINGVTIATLKDYLAVVIQQPGRFNMVELSRVIGQINTVTGTRALFFERLSGGPVFTAGQGTDADESPSGSR